MFNENIINIKFGIKMPNALCLNKRIYLSF